jgi:hypothetical protein
MNTGFGLEEAVREARERTGVPGVAVGLQVGRERSFAADGVLALDALTSWDAWNRLRTAQGCSVSRARRILTATTRTLVEGSAR